MELDREFHFETDVCASDWNAKCKKYWTIKDDGLSKDWTGICWMNPPYGRQVESWIAKAYESSLRGATVVCLLPARTDTAWWHKYSPMATEIRFLRGRVKFINRGGTMYNAPFPSVILIFKPKEAA